MPKCHFREYAQLGDRFRTALNEFQLMKILDFTKIFTIYTTHLLTIATETGFSDLR